MNELPEIIRKLLAGGITKDKILSDIEFAFNQYDHALFTTRWNTTITNGFEKGNPSFLVNTNDLLTNEAFIKLCERHSYSYITRDIWQRMTRFFYWRFILVYQPKNNDLSSPDMLLFLTREHTIPLVLHDFKTGKDFRDLLFCDFELLKENHRFLIVDPDCVNLIPKKTRKVDEMRNLPISSFYYLRTKEHVRFKENEEYNKEYPNAFNGPLIRGENIKAILEQ